MEKVKLFIGIIVNNDYTPSFEASRYISRVLNNLKIKNKFLSLDDLIKNNFNCDLVFNVYYGDFGDGGIISGILKTNKINFIGNSQYVSSLMLNKIISKKIFKKHGFNTPNFWYLPNFNKSILDYKKEINANLQYPFLCKPVNGSASEQITIINNSKELVRFLTKNKIQIDSGYFFFEEFVYGREFSAGYIKSLDCLLPIVEIELKKTIYQSNEVKFGKGLKNNLIPAPIEQKIYKRIQIMAKKLNEIFNAETFSRFDMIYSKLDKKIYILDINTNPGLLENSLLPLMARHIGLDENSLFTKLIENALKNN